MTGHAHAKRGSFLTRKARDKDNGELYELQADAIKALANPKRLLIVDLLSDGSERTVTQLQDETGLSQSNVSQNLAILRTAGLVHARRDGNNVFYSVSDERVLKAVTLLRAVMEAQFQDKRLLTERRVLKRKESMKRNSALGFLVGVGLLALVGLGAVTHPMWIGGDLADVEAHAGIMLQSGSFDAMMQACADVLTEPMTTPPSSEGAAA